ncbi:P1 family peptidase [Actinophytocola gossypii]|uniref:P1 family peptidase n=1 Tax=Actinophytocola gossypii TaxID=2812003 RepID=A0ABT2JJU3_9PSEU|nr:P1 family peptidase [Actinophytocola gossypii]MCT2588167.1 P1 family peptidase [Actinophytocola gossypii]
MHNAITDVPGVLVGHTTVRRPPDIHTGVTAIVPAGIGPHRPVPAGLFVGNGFGKLVGATQLAELGQLESPIVLTGTLSAFRAADALVTWMLAQPENTDVTTFNPVVGECNDGYLSDIRARPVTEAHVLDAIAAAAPGPVEQGCVGAGTGTVALGYKAGIGTASRRLGGHTLGVLVQANFGGTLRRWPSPDPTPEHGSCVIVAATDLPLDARQLGRLARRLVFALGRVGAAYAGGSGDYGIAFATTRGEPVPDAELSPLFEAALDATEDAVLNSLFAATTTTGRLGRTGKALAPRP